MPTFFVGVEGNEGSHKMKSSTFSWEGKATATHFVSTHYIQGGEAKGHFLPAEFQIKLRLCSSRVHIQKKKIMQWLAEQPQKDYGETW